jgi:FG-GAP-like repeat
MLARLKNLAWMGLLAGCQPGGPHPGAQLAARHCQSCHQLPAPAGLSKAMWRQVLPRMAVYLGWWHVPERNGYLPLPADVHQKLAHWGTVPAAPLVTAEELAQLHDYFEQLAPEQLPAPPAAVPVADLPGFVAHNLPAQAEAPFTLLLQTEAGRAGFWRASGHGQRLYWHGPDLQVRDSVPAPWFAVHAWPEGPPGQYLLTGMGLFNPADLAVGGVYRLRPPAQGPPRPERVLDSLRRPVHTAQADLNRDGRPDLVVCEFGANVGRLAWYAQQADGRYVRHVLDPHPGACRSHLTDWDGDGDPDVIAIFGQGREGVFYYENLGNEQFKARPWLEFAPWHGSNYLEVADFDADGRPDLLCTNGDNADFPSFPPALKPYHGVRVFLNRGAHQFEEAFFYPLNGAGQALARDFDQDGDLDIATISYFPDPARPPGEGFVYLENQGGLRFAPRTFADNQRGWWLVMSAGDYDADGDLDLLLGSAVTDMPVAAPAARARWLRERSPGVVLRNQVVGGK